MLKTKPRIPETFDQLLAALGGIHPSRVRLDPPPGRAKVADVVRLNDHHDRLYELVDGTLVEKAMEFLESSLGAELIYRLHEFLEVKPLGEVVGADGMMQISPNLLRIPDVAFVSTERFPGGRLPTEQVPEIVPDLAVEVLSPSNTAGEMRRKLEEYFRAGVRLVWFVDRIDRTVTVYTAPNASETLGEGDTLDGGAVLPGFGLPLTKLFRKLPQEATKKKDKKKPRE
jgi:Uma2 family endonuclease